MLPKTPSFEAMKVRELGFVLFGRGPLGMKDGISVCLLGNEPGVVVSSEGAEPVLISRCLSSSCSSSESPSSPSKASAKVRSTASPFDRGEGDTGDVLRE